MNQISVSDFIDTRLRLYSAQSNIRGIPFIGDGFKESHRKAVWGVLKRGEHADKDTVERIAAAAASTTDYHHGVGSLEGTIIGLAKSYAGTNNLPIFEAHGQFGSRLSHAAASSRYVKTKLSPTFRQLFKKEDDLLFEFRVSNDQPVEPKFFTPILPLVLVNGAEGMGTGHATFILAHDPEEIRAAILKILDGKKYPKLVPSWKGYNGTVSRDELTDQITVSGKYEIKTGRTCTVRITELPINKTTEQYKAELHKLEDKGIVLDFDDMSDKNGFDFICRVPKEVALRPDEEIRKIFKLDARETQNLTVWDGDGVLTRFETPEALLEHWVEWRVARYEDRRQALIKKMNMDIAWANLKIRFIRFYLANYKFFRDTPNKELVARLVQEGFDRHDELLAMPMRNLTHDKIKELEKDVEDLKLALAALQTNNAVSMFKSDLKELKL